MPKINATQKLIIAAVILLVTGAGAIFYLRMQTPLPEVSDRINYEPPTAEEVAAGDKQKEENLQKENTPKPSNAVVLISDAEQYGNMVEVRAYVSNTVEDGGTCTTTFTTNEYKVTRNTSAFRDATSTQCGAIDVPRSEFRTSGKWTVTVAYTSSAISGTSQPSSVIIK